jgi:1-acyl-sn-glycerol-3-phosphate acyltransferase
MSIQHKIHKTPFRLRLMISVLVKLYIGKIEVLGWENLEKIKPDDKVILAISHISDLDVPIAGYALCHRFNLAAAHQSMQTFWHDPSVYLGMLLAGKKNFFPIDYQKSGDSRQGLFNPENFVKMKINLENSDKTLIIAAHSPSRNWRLEKSGVGAVFLTQIMKDAIIIPVAVNIQSAEPLGMGRNRFKTILARPRAKVMIGKSIKIPVLPEFKNLDSIIEKMERGQKITDNERQKFMDLRGLLREKSGVIMSSLARMLPTEKRGIFQ